MNELLPFLNVKINISVVRLKERKEIILLVPEKISNHEFCSEGM